MKILIVEDDYISRKIIQRFLNRYGECDIAVDGMEAIDAYLLSLEDQSPYDLICLDIMMPKVDGIAALRTIRQLEEQRVVPKDRRPKIIMTTALDSMEQIQLAFDAGASGYAVKPIDMDKMIEVMTNLGLNLDM